MPDPDLTPEQLAELARERPSIIVDADGNPIVSGNIPETIIPYIPMFWDRQLNLLEYDESFARLGRMRLAATNLVPYVYYMECPHGVTTETNSCGATRPFGGLAQTIAGQRCFQFFCDGDSHVETAFSQFSGCGLVNDGWQ